LKGEQFMKKMSYQIQSGLKAGTIGCSDAVDNCVDDATSAMQEARSCRSGNREACSISARFAKGAKISCNQAASACGGINT
jgi:hypothetical protein